MNSKRIFNIGMVVLITAVFTLILRSSTQAAPPRYTGISGNVVWDSNQTISTDTVVQSGSSLTINSGVIVTVDTSQPDPSPYTNGLSPKIEIIVENGGTLTINGATLTEGNTTAGAWYGVVYLAGSSGSITNAAIRYGTVGVTIKDASPSITGTTIEYLSGDDAVNPSMDGGDAVGIEISGVTTSQIQNNRIRSINGGSGMAGENGTPGTTGANGGNGGDGIGIVVAGASAAPHLSDNTIEYLGGGNGGWGGDGGNGDSGSFSSGDGDGYDGGLGGDGGDGGNITAIKIHEAGTNCIVESNFITGTNGGGSGNFGGSGGNGGAGANGIVAHPNGGDGGVANIGGDGGVGGHAVGIILFNSSAIVKNNSIGGSLTGGLGSTGWWGGDGGAGGRGYSPTSNGNGGNGGRGGRANSGGSGGVGGDAIGIAIGGVSNADIRHNDIRAAITGGRAGDAGYGGWGGYGGDGGDAFGNGAGGNGGVGGIGGIAGAAERGGNAHGIWVAADEGQIRQTQSGQNPEMRYAPTIVDAGGVTIARNSITLVRGGGAAEWPSYATGGHGGNGGAGGVGVGSLNGGAGGAGGNGGDGSDSTSGGSAFGIRANASVRLENNLIYDVKGGNGGNSGDGGTGGDGGNGGAVTGTGSVGAGGVGGNGGAGLVGGDAGAGTGLMAITSASTNIACINNTISAVNGNSTVGAGSNGGAGGTGGSGAADGTAGQNGTAGDQSNAYGMIIDGNLSSIVVVNNIIAMSGAGFHQPAAATTAYYGIYADAAAATSLDYNLVYGWGSLGGDSANYKNVTAGTHDVNADPRFTDAGQGDYSLLSNSPAIDTGSDSYGGLTYPVDDIDGNGRPANSSYDMGAYEFGASGSANSIYLPMIVK